MAIDDDIGLLRKLAFFEPFDQDQLRLMLFAADRRTLKAGETLFTRGSLSTSGFIIQSGSIALKPNHEFGEEQILGPGTLIGEMALIVPSERPCDAVAKEPTSLIGLPRTLLHRIFSEYPDTAKKLRIQLARRLKDFTEDLERVGKVFDDLG